MNNEVIKDHIKNIFFQVFPEMPESDFEWNKKQEQYENWDSFAQLQIIVMAEEIFHVKISDKYAIKICSGKDLMNTIKELKCIP